MTAAPRARAASISAASAGRSSIVPVGFAGEATISPAIPSGRSSGRGLEAVLDPRGDAHGREAQRLQDLPVGRIARIAHRHPVARVEERREGQKERARGARRHDHPRGVEVHPVPVPVEPRDAGAERGQPERHGVAERVLPHRPASAARAPRRGRAGLADLHVDDAGAGRLGRAGGLHHVHHDEGIDLAAS
jgi:hypothetical protein